VLLPTAGGGAGGFNNRVCGKGFQDRVVVRLALQDRLAGLRMAQNRVRCDGGWFDKSGRVTITTSRDDEDSGLLADG
jgi:hypothetical protein